MTVRELIQKLEALDRPDDEVVVRLLGRNRYDGDRRRWTPPFIDLDGSKRKVYLG